LREELQINAQRQVESAARSVPEDHCVTKLVQEGAPVRVLLEQAKVGPWDAVVIGRGSSFERSLRSWWHRPWLRWPADVELVVVD